MEGSTVELRVCQGVAPSLKEVFDKVGQFASFKPVSDGKVPIGSIQRDGSGYGDLDDPCFAIPSKEFRSFVTEKRVCHALVEFGPMSQVVIEAVEQSATGERQRNLPLSVPGFVALSILEQGRIERLFVPSRMA